MFTWKTLVSAACCCRFASLLFVPCGFKGIAILIVRELRLYLHFFQFLGLKDLFQIGSSHMKILLKSKTPTCLLYFTG